MFGILIQGPPQKNVQEKKITCPSRKCCGLGSANPGYASLNSQPHSGSEITKVRPTSQEQDTVARVSLEPKWLRVDVE